MFREALQDDCSLVNSRGEDGRTALHVALYVRCVCTSCSVETPHTHADAMALLMPCK